MISIKLPDGMDKTKEVMDWKAETEEILSKKMEDIFNTSEFKDFQSKVYLEVAAYGESITLAKFMAGEITLECIGGRDGI